MDRRTYNKHRIFAGFLFLWLLVSGGSYYLDLGLFGRFDKGVLLLAIGAVLVWGTFFSPTREDMRRHRAGNQVSGLAQMVVRALFVCSQNRLRSPTAEQVFSSVPGLEVDSAGLNNDADTPLTPEQIMWADVIFVMEKTHRNKLSKRPSLLRSRTSSHRTALLSGSHG
jgi:predicted protein tyrosine phosphatase